MTTKAQRSWLLTILVALGLAVTSGMSLVASATAQDLPFLPPGQPTIGEVTDRDGDLWLVRGCAGDPITITMESDVFTPYLELTDAEDELLADGIGEDGLAVLTSDPLSATTVYTLAAAGDRRSARGAYTLTLTSARVDALTDVDGIVAYAVPVTGEVRSRLGELWGLAGCPGDEVTVTVTSAVFSPYLEIVDLESGDSLVTGAAEADESAQIAAFALPAGDAYGIVVAGARIVDRGPYTLSVTTVLTGAAVPTSTTPLVTEPARASAPTRTPVPTPIEDTCTVNVEGLNLRSGPDTAYDPPLGSLPLGAELRMLARNPAATWVQVEVAATGEKGWVSASSQFVTCTRYTRELAVGVIPPTPTPLPTPTPTPTFTPTPTPTSRPTQVTVPTPPAFVLLPGGGPSGGGWNTEIVSGRGMVNAVDGVAIFRDRMYVRLEIYSTPNNRDVRSVRFTIVPDGDFDPVNEQTEGNAGYCSFGGGEPECNVLRLDAGARWPSSGLSIDNGDYTVNMEVELENGDGGTWSAPIRIDSPALGGDTSGPQAPQRPIEVQIVETGPGTSGDLAIGALTFRAAANDPDVGPNDGDGIQYVDMWVYGPDGREVRYRREQTAGYCIFQGGEPECNVWNFADHDYNWPEGEGIEEGMHRLVAIAKADDGREEKIEKMVEVQY